MITRRTVAALIDESEVSFNRCWDMLDTIRRAEDTNNLRQAFVSFQPDLALAIRGLDELRRALHREKHQLIGRKSQPPTRSFSRRMRQIASYHEALDASIDIGKTIGDAFAWIFYQNQREWLSRHEAHPRDRYLPSGLGGRGEIEFVRNAPVFNGCLVLYHGITTFLRLGDVSLFDLAKRTVVGIGELKTAGQDGDQITLHMTIVGNRDLRMPPAASPNAPIQRTDLPPAMAERLRRQVRAMGLAFEKAGKPSTAVQHTVNTTSRHAVLEIIHKSLHHGHCAHVKAGDGLLLTAFVDPRASLSERIMDGLSPSFKQSLDTVLPHAKSICDETSKDNSITIATLHYSSEGYSHFHGMIPLYWWPAASAFLRDVAFRRTVIVGLYNPAFLVRKLRNRGFVVTQGQTATTFAIERRTKDGRLGKICGFSYLAGLVQRHLLSEEMIVDLMDKVMSDADDPKYMGRNVRINMDIQHFDSRDLRTTACTAYEARSGRENRDKLRGGRRAG